MGTEEKNDKDNMETSGSKGKLIPSELKEVTEFLSDLFPVLGSIFLIIVMLTQYWYSNKAESFYGIDKSLFYSKNLVYFVTISIIALGSFVILFLSYLKSYSVQKKDLQDFFIIIIMNVVSMIVPLFVLMMKFPNLIVNIILFIIGIVIIPIFDIVLSDKSKPKAMYIYIVIKILIIAAYLFTINAYIKIISKSEIEFKKDYEIAFPVDSNNTDWYYGSKNNHSQIFDIVILHRDSQVLLMKGKIEKAKLTLYKGVYSFQDIDKYMYIKKNFEGVSPTEEFPSEATQTEASPSELSK